MYTKESILTSPFDFDNAIFFGLNVSVWQNGSLIDYGGTKDAHSANAVTINGGYYLKAVCEFRIR